MPELDCMKCTAQRTRGCFAKKRIGPGGKEEWLAAARNPVKIDDELSYACPRQSLRESPKWWNTLLFYYGLYKKGLLPDEGGVSAQSNRAMQLFALLDETEAECAEEKRNKEARAGNRPTPAKRGR